MDSWEFNKIAAAVLSALLIAFGSSTVLGLMKGGHGAHGDGHAKSGYTLPVDVASISGGSQGTETKKAGLDFVAVATALQTADASAGEGVFKKCKTCHTDKEGGKNAVGPNLWNIVNRDMATVGGFKYSQAVKSKGGKWDFESLANFMYAPKRWMKGTKMAFAGIKDTTDLANVLAYLRSLSASPAALPTPAAAASAPAAPAPAVGGEEKPKEN